MAELARALGTRDAVAIGLGSMVGAGLFSAFAPAAAAAGSALIFALLLAAFIAYCNATASAQLAAQYPSSGGTYIYGRERLNHTVGFLAGWGFVVGKTASCAAMALTVGAYLFPDSTLAQKITGIFAVLSLTAINLRGITKTALMARVLLTIVLICLTFVLSIASINTSGGVHSIFSGWTGGPWGILQAAAFLFFAFAGYARIATMGEEVKNPQRTIPRAILWALSLAVLLYTAVALMSLKVLGAERIAASTAPLRELAQASGSAFAEVAVLLAAVLAALGALLALITGVSRTLFAMARNADLPRFLAGVDSRYRVPVQAELSLAVVVCLLLCLTDIRHAIGFSSCGVLIYYFIANLAAATQSGEHRRYPRVLQVLGMAGCAALICALPPLSIAGGCLMFFLGLGARVLLRQKTHGKPPQEG